jgi:hypothetical protein
MQVEREVQSQIGCVLVGQQESALSLTQQRPVSRKRKVRCGGIRSDGDLLSRLVFRLFFCQHHPAYSVHAWQVGLNTFTWHQHLYLSTKHPSLRLVDNLTIHHHLLEDWRIDVRGSKFNSETSALKTTHSCSRPTRSGRVSEQSTAVHSHPQTRL